MRILAVDYGERRIGLAVSDELGITAQPLDVLRNEGVLAAAQMVAQVASARKVAEIIVGLPSRTDAKEKEKEGGQEQRVVEFVASLRKATSIPVKLFDERFTTVIAQRAMLEGDVPRRERRKKVDKVAAAVLLQGYLESQRAGRHNRTRI